MWMLIISSLGLLGLILFTSPKIRLKILGTYARDNKTQCISNEDYSVGHCNSSDKGGCDRGGDENIKTKKFTGKYYSLAKYILY